MSHPGSEMRPDPHLWISPVPLQSGSSEARCHSVGLGTSTISGVLGGVNQATAMEVRVACGLPTSIPASGEATRQAAIANPDVSAHPNFRTELTASRTNR